MAAVDYIDAVRELASSGTEYIILFSRLSDKDCMTIARKLLQDETLRAAVLHPNCAGLVDTFLIDVARKAAL